MYKKYVSSYIQNNPQIERGTHVENELLVFISLLATAATIATPEQKAKAKTLITNSGIELLVRNERRLRRDCKTYRSPDAKIRLKMAENKLKMALRYKEERNIKNLITSLTPNVSAKKYLGKASENLKPAVSTEVPLRLRNGSYASTDEEKASCFAEHLSNVFQLNFNFNARILSTKIEKVADKYES